MDSKRLASPSETPQTNRKSASKNTFCVSNFSPSAASAPSNNLLRRGLDPLSLQPARSIARRNPHTRIVAHPLHLPRVLDRINVELRAMRTNVPPPDQPQTINPASAHPLAGSFETSRDSKIVLLQRRKIIPIAHDRFDAFRTPRRYTRVHSTPRTPDHKNKKEPKHPAPLVSCRSLGWMLERQNFDAQTNRPS